MKLRPLLEAPRPSYPEGPPWRRGLLRSLRRVTASCAVAGSLWIAGCYGATAVREVPEPEADIVDVADADSLDPEGDADVSERADADVSLDAELAVEADVETPNPVLLPCEPEPRLSGFVGAPQYFTCSWNAPPPRQELPVYLGEGRLCPGGASVAYFGLDGRTRLRIGLLDYQESVLLTVMDTQGRVITQLGPGNDCLELEAGPDSVGLGAGLASSSGSPEASFEFYVDLIDDEDSPAEP